MRSRDLPRRQGRGCAGGNRADAQSLSRQSQRARGKLRRFHAPARDRCVESFVRDAGERMTQTTPPPLPTLIPETAPFSPEQRSWLNGFLAGLLSLESGVNPLTAAESAALVPAVGGVPESRGPLHDGDDGQAPWHDPAMPLTERMQLAESRPLRRRMMAAMGQQDCGQCGYNCEDYANAISIKSEERLNLCVPGGKETARMLKTLYAEFGAIPAAAKPATVQAASAQASPPAIPKASAPVPALAAPAASAVSAPSRNHPAEVAF